MRMAGTGALVLLSAMPLQAQVAAGTPVCQADQHGSAITTRIEYPDGYTVEAPWQVTGSVRAGALTTITAVLDRVVETRPFSNRRQMTALPNAIEVTFRGKTTHELLNEAANIWCMTVLKARPLEPSALAGRTSLRDRIMM